MKYRHEDGTPFTKEEFLELNEVYKNYVKSFFKGELKENYEGGGYDFNIPRKLITITYKDKTIESYVYKTNNSTD